MENKKRAFSEKVTGESDKVSLGLTRVKDNKKYTMVVFTPDIEQVKDENNNDAGGGDTAAPIFKSIVKKLCNK